MALTYSDFKGNEFKALDYEFMPNESMYQWLHNHGNELPQLS